MSLSSATPVPKAFTTPTRPARHGSRSASPTVGQRAALVGQPVLVGAPVDDVDAPRAAGQADVEHAGAVLEVCEGDERDVRADARG